MLKRTIELANVVITFGDTGLVSNLEAKILPVIRDGSIKGRGEVRSYLIHKLTLEYINTTPTLSGRLIKFMNIEAEQEFDHSTDMPVPSDESMSAAPSSFFAIDLHNHRMAFLHETRRCPSLRDLQYCIDRLLFDSWKTAKQEAIAMEREKYDGRFPRGKLSEIEAGLESTLPMPIVRLTPLPALQEVEDKFAAYHMITGITIQPLKTNNEMPDENQAFLRSIEERKNKLKAKETAIRMTNNDEGLDKTEATKTLIAASTGNYKVNVRGKTESGKTLTGNIEETAIKIPTTIPEAETNTERTIRLISSLHEALKEELVYPAQAESGVDVDRIVKQILEDEG